MKRAIATTAVVALALTSAIDTATAAASGRGPSLGRAQAFYRQHVKNLTGLASTPFNTRTAFCRRPAHGSRSVHCSVLLTAANGQICSDADVTVAYRTNASRRLAVYNERLTCTNAPASASAPAPAPQPAPQPSAQTFQAAVDAGGFQGYTYTGLSNDPNGARSTCMWDVSPYGDGITTTGRGAGMQADFPSFGAGIYVKPYLSLYYQNTGQTEVIQFSNDLYAAPVTPVPNWSIKPGYNVIAAVYWLYINTNNHQVAYTLAPTYTDLGFTLSPYGCLVE